MPPAVMLPPFQPNLSRITSFSAIPPDIPAPRTLAMTNLPGDGFRRTTVVGM